MKVPIRIVLCFCLSLLNKVICFRKATETLKEGDTLESENGKYYLNLNPNGKLEVLKKAEDSQSPDVVLWSTKTEGKGKPPRQLVMQVDGELVIFSSPLINIWSSKSSKVKRKVPPYKLIIENDGSLVIYDKNKKIIWKNK